MTSADTAPAVILSFSFVVWPRMQRPGLRPHSPVTTSQSMTPSVPSIQSGHQQKSLAMEFASKYSARLHRRNPDRRSPGDGACLIAIQLLTQPSDRLKVPAPVFPDNRPTALRVMPFAAPTESKVASGSGCPPPLRTTRLPQITSAPTERGCPQPPLVNDKAP